MCCSCGCDIASEASLLWEGYMGACTPALLFRHAVNVEPSAAEREEVGARGGLCDWGTSPMLHRAVCSQSPVQLCPARPPTTALPTLRPWDLGPLPCRCRVVQVLSTGRYTLADVRCRACCITLGWQYLAAESRDQQYKVGAVLLQQAALEFSSPMQQEQERGQSPTPPQLAQAQY